MEKTGFKLVKSDDFKYPELGIGIVGYGFMGKTHINAYKKCSYLNWPPAVIPKLVALCGKPELEKETKEAAYRFGFEGYYNSYELMVQNPGINLVDICAPDDLHHDPVMSAIKSGKNVFCEKPLAMTVKDAKEMYEAARIAGVKHMVGHNYRFFPAVRLARDLIDKGLFGKLYEFRGRYLQSYGSSPDEPVENIWYASGTKSGINLGIGSHIIDMARFLTGEIVSVCSLQKTFNKTRNNVNGQAEKVNADESNLSIVEFENGAIGSIESSGVASGRLNQHTWELNASEGSMYWDLEDPNHLHVYLKKTPVKEITGFTKVSVTHSHDPFACLSWPPGHNIGWENGHVNEIYHLIGCIAGNRDIEPYGATFYDGYVNQAIMDAIKDSTISGKKVKLNF